MPTSDDVPLLNLEGSQNDCDEELAKQQQPVGDQVDGVHQHQQDEEKRRRVQKATAITVQTLLLADRLHQQHRYLSSEELAQKQISRPITQRELQYVPPSIPSRGDPIRWQPSLIVTSRGGLGGIYPTSYTHAQHELRSLHKALVIFAGIALLLGTPLSLLCTIPAILCIYRVCYNKK